jgi:hypothetical protein
MLPISGRFGSVDGRLPPKLGWLIDGRLPPMLGWLIDGRLKPEPPLPMLGRLLGRFIDGRFAPMLGCEILGRFIDGRLALPMLGRELAPGRE